MTTMTTDTTASTDIAASPWIEVGGSRVFSGDDLAIKLYPPESPNLAISLSAYEAMGQPVRIACFYDPRQQRIGLRACDEGRGYTVHQIRDKDTGRLKGIQLHAARPLRRMVTDHRGTWPAHVTMLPLVQDGEYWVATLPSLSEGALHA